MSSMSNTTISSFIPQGNFGFQIPNTSLMEGIIRFHNDLSVFLIFILVFVIYMLYIVVDTFKKSSSNVKTEKLIHASLLEILWTTFPAIILILIAIPSFSLLYSIDEILDSNLTIKVLGHQWYWTYEYLSLENLSFLFSLESSNFNKTFLQDKGSFDSYMLSEEDVVKAKIGSNLRLLTVDNHLVLYVNMPIRILISSEDVLHSWAVPSLGVKVDACPGRLNQTIVLIKREGFSYGQCSEICGVNHGFMPIGLYSYYIPYLKNAEFLSEIISSLKEEDLSISE